MPNADINFFGKIKLILYPKVKNAMIQLTLIFSMAYFRTQHNCWHEWKKGIFEPDFEEQV